MCNGNSPLPLSLSLSVYIHIYMPFIRILSFGDQTLNMDNYEILCCWKDLVEYVLNSDSPIDCDIVTSIPAKKPVMPELSFVPILTKMKDAIKEMSSDKSPRSDDIHSEIYKHLWLSERLEAFFGTSKLTPPPTLLSTKMALRMKYIVSKCHSLMKANWFI